MVQRIGELAAHLFEAFVEARRLVHDEKTPYCPDCEVWLGWQLAGLGT